MKKEIKRITDGKIDDGAERGMSIPIVFSYKGKTKKPIQRVNVDFSMSMLKELDALASELNISRQALIKTYLRQALDDHYRARKHGIGQGVI